MIQHFIKMCLGFLKRVCDCIEEAYEMTYKEVSKNFTEEVKRRKQINKQSFFDKAKNFVKDKYQEETGEIMPDNVAQEFAETFFKIAKIRGDVNALNEFRPNEEKE